MEDELVTQMHDLRQRILDGEDISSEEYKKVLDGLRGGRVTASEKSTGKGRSSVEEIDLDKLF